MKSVNDEITEAFFAYLRDRNISDETKFAWFEKQRVETGIDYVDYYNGLIDWAGKFLMEFEELHREDKRYMYLTKRFTREQVEEVLTEENLGIELSRCRYTEGRLQGYYYYNEAKKDRLFFQVALKMAQNKDIEEAYNKVKELIKECKEKATEERQRLKTTFSQTQLETLCELLKNRGYIFKDTERELFVWLFGGKAEPQQYKAIVWTLKNERGPHKGKPAKTALMYMIQGLLGKNPSAEEQRTICKMFVDDQGKGINLPKPKNKEYDYLGNKIQDIIKSL